MAKVTVTAANDGKVYKLPSKPTWRTGPPPSIGWWPATNARVDMLEVGESCHYLTFLRWWDGKKWSQCCAFPTVTARIAANSASGPKSSDKIHWTDRWWENQK